MFTLDQIDEIHERLGNQATLPEYLRALNAVGVEKYDSFITDGHSEYYGTDGEKIISPAVHKKFTIADTSDREEMVKHLSLHNDGKTDYLEMSQGLADSGVEKWSFDTRSMTITYHGIDGRELLVEALE